MRNPYEVRCPTCLAPPNVACTSTITGRRKRDPHPERVAKANPGL